MEFNFLEFFLLDFKLAMEKDLFTMVCGATSHSWVNGMIRGRRLHLIVKIFFCKLCNHENYTNKKFLRTQMSKSVVNVFFIVSSTV